MQYREICQYYSRLENTTKRLEMTDILAVLLKYLENTTNAETIAQVVYLTQGTLYPDWTGKPEIGIAEKMAINAISIALGINNNKVTETVNTTGDIGTAIEKLLESKRQTALFQAPLSIQQVHGALVKIASAQGSGSADLKIRTLAGLINASTPLEARYLLRTVTGTLRLGIAEMTVIDALAQAFAGGKEHRDEIERAYNITSDLGYIAGLIAFEGLDSIEKVKVQIGKPIRMMAAQKLSTPQEISEKLESKFASEWKLDGERMQIHKRGDDIVIFSRRLEQITSMYPDVVQLILTNIKAKDCIIEGEAVAVDKQDPQKLLPFQILMRRRRKYKIEEMIQEIPVAIFFFDCLFVNGTDLTHQPYLTRRNHLEEIVDQNNFARLVPAQVQSSSSEIEKMFRESLDNGGEGLIVKSTKPDSIYRAGARSWLWVKLKESYQAQAIGPVDLVVVGAFWGRGRRAKTYGALLAAVRDEESGEFKTVCKVGTGFSDEELEQLPERFKPYLLKHKDALVDSKMEADVWFRPALVFQVVGDEITRSPVHTCAYDQIAPNEGLAIRFPRFDGTWRDDKSPEEATSTEVILNAYKSQTKVKE
ncbi:MAG: ATP-dependent DNA ligase [Promethearchaeota archaeon]